MKRRADRRGAGERAPPPRPDAAGPSLPSGEARHGAAADEVVRLSNRTALLTFGAAFALIAGLVALPTALSGGASALVRVAAAVPMLVALLAAAAAWRARVTLREAATRRAAP